VDCNNAALHKPIFTGVTGPMSDESLAQLRLDVERTRQQAKIDSTVTQEFLIETEFTI